MRKFHQQKISERQEKPSEGKICEGKLIGECTEKHQEHLPYHLAIAQVKENQPTKLPQFAEGLTDTVDYLLHPDELDGTENIKFYTACGSTLDKKHGIDAFMEINDNGKVHRITLDITMNPTKIEHKADVIIHVPEEGINMKNNPQLFRKTTEEAAKQIIKKFEEKKEQFLADISIRKYN
ncbi:hypothetical protein A2515_04440 [Candidatus Falkowbacteria bacterium RIFOXYD12_FULL_34_57]|nr:MAG: hypothetical protein A2500_04075 [Candidatus Falkowbacteria bacterium RIFOXYC12_FULL_34_55]OGF39544.1 MAG: hypothetical protein A2515_04440 [Candidatus Falkowbacteria bacterium RIFOXYD12_FULL_34_57]